VRGTQLSAQCRGSPVELHEVRGTAMLFRQQARRPAE
jgi:hypothetical protein